MNWFKHDTNAVTDAKIKKLILKYGAEGYAIYFHCIELIASDISETNINFCLEHDSEIIADNLKIKGTAEQSGINKVEEIMRYLIELKLFEERNNIIYCFKLLKRLDTSMTSNVKFRSIIKNAKKSHDLVMTESCKIRRDKIRIDNMKEDNKPDRTNLLKAVIKDKFFEYGKKYKENKNTDNYIIDNIYKEKIFDEEVLKCLDNFFKYKYFFNNDGTEYNLNSFLANIQNCKKEPEKNKQDAIKKSIADKNSNYPKL